LDRVLRGAFAVLVGVFYLLGTLSGPLALALGLVAVVLLVTSAVGWCPLYALTGIKTFKRD
jgi:hypothetical protein